MTEISKTRKIIGWLLLTVIIPFVIVIITIDPFGPPTIILENQTQLTLGVTIAADSDEIWGAPFFGTVEPGQQIKFSERDFKSHSHENFDYWTAFFVSEREVVFSKQYSYTTNLEKTGWKTYKGIISPPDD